MKRKQNNFQKLIFYSFLLMFSCCKQLKNEGNVKEYSLMIELAESELLNEEYASALSFYEKSEKHLSNVLGVDCYNALMASIEIKNWESSTYWALRLVEKGIDLNYFSQEIFQEFRTSDAWPKFVTKFKSSRAKFQLTFNKELKIKLEKLIAADQQVYCQIPNNNSYALKNENSEELENTFYNLLKNRELFSEEEIGLNVINKHDIIFSPIYYVLLRHSFQNGNELANQFLKSGVNLGIIKPEFKQLVEITPFSDKTYLLNGGDYYKLKKSNISSLYKRKIEYNHYSQDKKFLFFAPYNEIEMKNSIDNVVLLDSFEKVNLVKVD